MTVQQQVKTGCAKKPMWSRFYYRPALSEPSKSGRILNLNTRSAISAIAMLLAITSPVVQSEQDNVPVNNQDKPCTLGVFPFISAQQLESVFAPIAAELESVMNCSLRYRSAVDFKTFTQKLENREFDIAFIQPFDYVQIASPKGYLPLVARNEELHAVIVTRTNSDVYNLVDLKDKIIALPPAAAAISYLARGILADAGLNVAEDLTIQYTKNHGACMHKVLIGKVAACATAPTTLHLFETQNQIKLRVIAHSPTLPSALFVVRDEISQEKYYQLQQKMLNLTLSASAEKLFNKEKHSQPFHIVADDEYDIIRQYCMKYRPLLKANGTYQCVDSKPPSESVQNLK